MTGLTDGAWLVDVTGHDANLTLSWLQQNTMVTSISTNTHTGVYVLTHLHIQAIDHDLQHSAQSYTARICRGHCSRPLSTVRTLYLHPLNLYSKSLIQRCHRNVLNGLVQALRSKTSRLAFIKIYTFLVQLLYCSGQSVTNYGGILIPEKELGPLEHIWF